MGAGGSDDRLGPGDDTWEDRLGPDDENWVRTRLERWFGRHGTLVGSLAVSVVLAVLGVASLLWVNGEVEDVRLRRERAAAATPFGVAGAPPVDGVPLNREDPFAGTGSADEADGEAGVVVPAVDPWLARRVPADQVTAAYQRVRQAVITARLDRRVVRDHDVEPLLALFAPEQRDGLRRRLEVPAEGVSVATRVAPGTRLLDVAPKVSGSMRAVESPSGGLAVHTHYQVVYPFDTDESLSTPTEAIASALYEVTYVVRGDALWLEDARGRFFGVSCAELDRGFVAPAVSDPRRVPCIR